MPSQYEHGPDFQTENEAEIARLKSDNARLLYACEPFIRAAEVIAKKPDHYHPRVAAVGGFSDACDLTVTHFARLLEAVQPL